MFRESILSNSIAVANSIADRGIAVGPLPNTFLDTLVTLAKNEAAVNAAGHSMADVKLNESPAAQFNCVLDELVESSAQILIRTQMLARTDAIPMIRDVVTKLNQVVNPDVPYAYSSMAVDQFIYPEIWASEYLQSVARQWSSSSLADGEAVCRGLYKSFDEDFNGDFEKLSKTGLPEVDRMIGVILNRYSVQALREMFDGAFVEGWVPSVFRNDYRIEAHDRLVLSYVWATNLKDPDNLPTRTDYSKVDYMNAITRFISVSGRHIDLVIKRREGDVRNERLVLDVSDTRVTVNGDTYPNWLKNEGACPEIILGASVGTAEVGRMSGRELLTDADKHIKAWNGHVGNTEASRREDLKSVLRAEVFRLFAEIIESRLAEGLLVEKASVFTKLNELMRVTNFNLKEPYWGVRELALELFYCDSDVGLFVRTMDELSKDDPSATEEDLPVLGTIYHVNRWIAKFITDTNSGVDQYDTNGKRRLADNNRLVLAAAVTLSTTLIKRVMGKQIGKNIAGSPVKDNALSTLSLTIIKNAKKL